MGRKTTFAACRVVCWREIPNTKRKETMTTLQIPIDEDPAGWLRSLAAACETTAEKLAVEFIRDGVRNYCGQVGELAGTLPAR
jgi:hypothetical protein